MKIAKLLLSTIIFLFFIFLFSCSKKDQPHSIPLIPPIDSIGAMNINLSYPLGTGFSSTMFELIISTKSDSVLLDTSINFTDTLLTKIRTNEKLVNVTTIYYNGNFLTYYVNTYKAVNPSEWNQLIQAGNGIYFPLPHQSSFTQGSIHYINTPTNYSGYPYFYASYSSGYHSTLAADYVDEGYDKYPNAYTYLLFPSTGLYKLYSPTKDLDTVDLSHMDTAVSMNFTKSAQYNISSVNLYGTPDTTDFTKFLLLYSSPVINYHGADIEYPHQSIQQFVLHVNGQNNNNCYVDYTAYADSVPLSLPFPDESYYAILNNQNNNFSVEFLNTMPSYYRTTWANSQISFNIYTSPDSTHLQPYNFLRSLHSQILKNLDITNLSLSQFWFENATNMNYSTFFKYYFNRDENKKRPLHSTTTFEKTF